MSQDAETVPTHLRHAWEEAYSNYISAASHDAATPTRNYTSLAACSARVALTWRRMAEVPGLGWCVLAAFVAAAEAFENQARELNDHRI
ncbi:hypothetical protein [Actinophytocola sediminis]